MYNIKITDNSFQVFYLKQVHDAIDEATKLVYVQHPNVVQFIGNILLLNKTKDPFLFRLYESNADRIKISAHATVF